MTLHAWKDFEKDLDARDRVREFWHGLLVFVALITIASLFGCERGPTYSPETQNALALTPLNGWAYTDSVAGLDGPPRPPKPEKKPKPDDSWQNGHGSTIAQPLR